MMIRTFGEERDISYRLEMRFWKWTTCGWREPRTLKRSTSSGRAVYFSWQSSTLEGYRRWSLTAMQDKIDWQHWKFEIVFTHDERIVHLARQLILIAKLLSRKYCKCETAVVKVGGQGCSPHRLCEACEIATCRETINPPAQMAHRKCFMSVLSRFATAFSA